MLSDADDVFDDDGGDDGGGDEGDRASGGFPLGVTVKVWLNAKVRLQE